MSKLSKERQNKFLLLAQRQMKKAVAEDKMSAKCSLSFSRREPCHHIWIRSNHNDQLSSSRDRDFFDVSLLPMFSAGRYAAPAYLVIRVWAETKDTRELLMRELGEVEGWKRTRYPRKKGTSDCDPQGAYDYTWCVDWEHLPADGWTRIVEAYNEIEGQLIKAKLLVK